MLASSLKDEGFTIIATCPGWVASDMGSGSNEVSSYTCLLSASYPVICVRASSFCMYLVLSVFVCVLHSHAAPGMPD